MRQHVGVERAAAASTYSRGSPRPRRSTDAALAHEVDERRRAARGARPTARVVGIVVDRRPRSRGRSARSSQSVAEVAVEQLAHRRAEPGRDVHAVGDVADRDVVDRRGRATAPCHISRATSPWRRLTPLARAARAQRELRDAERLVRRRRGACGPRRTSSSSVDAERRRRARRAPRDLLGRVGVVAGRDRRVGGEDRALARPRPARRRARRRRAARAGELERGERGVALVEVHDAGLDAQRLAARARRRRRAARTAPGACRGSPT